MAVINHPKLTDAQRPSDAGPNAAVCPSNYGSLQGTGTAWAEVQPETPLRCRLVWETHSSDVLGEVALGVPFPAGLGCRVVPGEMPGCCSPSHRPRNAPHFCLALNSKPENEADVF